MIQLLLAVIYISFISLGLPDALLGSAWPTIYTELQVPVSYAGIVSMIIAGGTVISSLMSERLIRKLGTGKVTAVSVAVTAAALLGFSVSRSFWLLCLWAIPYGVGAGCVDAALNNYVALHYASRHMSWLHCMWGIGAAAGPYIMGYVLTSGRSWNLGYRCVGLFQIVLTVILALALPLWKTISQHEGEGEKSSPLPLSQIVRTSGAKEGMLCFFCYCALEQTAGLWASSYLVLVKNVANETAAFFAGMFYVGITVGRALSGFLTTKFSDAQMIWIGEGIGTVGIAAMLLPAGEWVSLLGLVLIGLGCAPVYPCMIHSTPAYFGAEKSQSIIGVQMASAYVGTCLMPELFGLIANHISVALLPVYLFVLQAVMAVMHKRLVHMQG